MKNNLKISTDIAIDPPMMLPNPQALTSPTTGSFRSCSLIPESSANSVAPNGDGNLANNLRSSCRFNSHTNPISFSFFSDTKDQVFPPSDLVQSSGTEVHYQTSAPTHLQIGFEYTTGFSSEPSSENYVHDSATDVKVLNTVISDIPSDYISRHKEHNHSENVGMHHIPEQKGPFNPPMGAGRTLEDGYNWRKYGHKQVKSGEHSRSYYKCTHPDCPMKKKVEESLDGQITEIIYNGCHDHPKPQPSRRSAVRSNVGVEDGSIWRNIQPGFNYNGAGPNWRANVLDRTSSKAAGNDLSNPLSMTQGNSMGTYTSAGTTDLSSTIASQYYGEDGSIPFEDDVDDEDSESKKRSVREPRVVVQVESEFDLLDDGYRWRKYGQKVVKGNQNPRSYYRCTSSGCLVRRHVERASNDPKSVITTYEGKHIHEVPAARKSSHGSSGSGGGGAQSALAFHRNANVSRPEELLHDLGPGHGPHFDMKPEFISNHEYIGPPNRVGNFANDMKFGHSSHYQVRLPPLQNTNHFVPLGLNSNNAETFQPGSIAPMAANFQMQLPSGLAMAANPGFDFNGNGNLVGQLESYFVGQQLLGNHVPKGELKDDRGDAKASSSSKRYHRSRKK